MVQFLCIIKINGINKLESNFVSLCERNSQAHQTLNSMSVELHHLMKGIIISHAVDQFRMTCCGALHQILKDQMLVIIKNHPGVIDMSVCNHPCVVRKR